MQTRYTICRSEWISNPLGDKGDGKALVLAAKPFDAGVGIETHALTVGDALRVVAAGGHEVIVNVTPLQQGSDGRNWDDTLSAALRMRALLKGLSMLKRPVKLVTVTGLSDPIGGLVHGLTRSLRLETGAIRHVWVDTPANLPLDKVIDAASRCIFPRSRMDDHLGMHRQVFRESGRVPAEYVSSINGGVLITGGGGGLGRLLAGYLAERGIRDFYLMGRREPDDHLAARLRESGCRAYICADVTDASALDGALEYIAARHRRIGAVFHLAARLDDALLVNQNENRFGSVLAPKVAGAINLARAAQKFAIKHIVHFSSLSGTAGLAGQTAYGAANGFLDAQAEHENLSGSPSTAWTSLSFGSWNAEGMAMTADARGMLPLEPVDAFDSMMNVMATPMMSHALIYNGDVDLGELSETVENRPAETGDSTLTGERTRTVEKDAVENFVRDVVARFTGLENLDADDNVLDHGADSVVAMNISADLERQFRKVDPRAKLGRSILFEAPTIASLAASLMETHKSALLAIAAPDDGPSRQLRDPRGQDGVGAAVKPNTAAATSMNQWKNGFRNNRDIAIIGLAGAVPGASDLPAFWNMLSNGRLAVSEIPRNRWDWRTDFDPKTGTAGKSYGRHGAFLDSPGGFDARFFNIMPSEAVLMDPEERKLLQTSYHALENSGYFADPHGSVGVFVAAMYSHYQSLDAPEALDNSFAARANRLSFAFDFKGPSLTLDSMCSGSLSALHLAVAALRCGECRQAIVAAANIMAHSGKYRMLSRGGFLSPTGRCHAFGAEADGYVPGEGVFSVVLKPLGAARADGDPIRAIIRGTAMNASGRTSGFTVPSASAQAAVIADALADAGCDPAVINYVEAHGTGTKLGDPIEIDGLRAGYNEVENCSRAVGSVKSNIGHLEAAAGLAGLAKIVLQLEHGQLAPSIGCEIVNPLIALDDGFFRIQRDLKPWNSSHGAPRHAGLSGFGAGGSNCHVIVAEYPDRHEPALSNTTENAAFAIPLSGKTKPALAVRLKELARFLDGRSDLSLRDVAYTLSRCREHHKHRICIVARSLPELCEQLETLDQGKVSSETEGDIARRYGAGETIDWPRAVPAGRVVPLPLYPFEETHYWSEHVDARPPTIPADPAVPADLVDDSGHWAELAKRDDLLVMTRRQAELPAASVPDGHAADVAPAIILVSANADFEIRTLTAPFACAERPPLIIATGAQPGGGTREDGINQLDVGHEAEWERYFKVAAKGQDRALILDLRALGACQSDESVDPMFSFRFARTLARSPRPFDLIVATDRPDPRVSGFEGLLRSMVLEKPALRAVSISMSVPAAPETLLRCVQEAAMRIGAGFFRTFLRRHDRQPTIPCRHRAARAAPRDLAPGRCLPYCRGGRWGRVCPCREAGRNVGSSCHRYRSLRCL